MAEMNVFLTAVCNCYMVPFTRPRQIYFSIILTGPDLGRLEEKISSVSFTFGIPDDELILELKRKGVCLTGTATSVDEAVCWRRNT